MTVQRVTKPAVLLLVAMVCVHALRSLFALSDHAAELGHGHGYPQLAVHVVMISSALALGAALERAAADASSRNRGHSVARRLWPAATAAVLALYGGHELLDGWSSPGHLAGWDALLAGNGWIAVPAALGFGLLIALSVAAARAISEVCRAEMRAPRPRAEPALVPLHRLVRCTARRDRLQGRHLAARAPPLVCG